MAYNALNHYWLAGNRLGVVFASARAAYVATTDAVYTEWLAAGNSATQIVTDGELSDVLTKAGASAATVAAAGSTSWGNVPPSDIRSAVTAAGLQINSTATPSINGVYGIEPQDEINMSGLQAGIAAGGAWLGGYRDINGARHMMTSAQATALFEGALAYIAACDEAYAMLATGGSPSWPTQPVTIA